MLTVKLLPLGKTGRGVHRTSLYYLSYFLCIYNHLKIKSLKNISRVFCVNPALIRLLCCRCFLFLFHPWFAFSPAFCFCSYSGDCRARGCGNCLQKGSFQLVFTSFGREHAGRNIKHWPPALERTWHARPLLLLQIRIRKVHHPFLSLAGHGACISENVEVA